MRLTGGEDIVQGGVNFGDRDIAALEAVMLVTRLWQSNCKK
jgi:hypothetical protein